jgi:pteridine reductase
MMEKALQGKTALVTGGAKRIGRAICLALAHEGANIVIHYRSSADNATELVDQVAAYGVKSWLIQADFLKRDEYETLIARAVELAGGLDILVNSASIFPAETLAKVTFESLVENLEINAWAPFVLIREFARLVGRGAVVNLVDSRVTGYDWNHVGYILSKHVLNALTNMAAVVYAPGITVNGVGPGLILPPPGRGDDYLDKMAQTVPLKRHGDAGEIADAVLYLVKATFVTGTTIYVDGGRHLGAIPEDITTATPTRPSETVP